MPVCFEVRINDEPPTVAGRSDIEVLIAAITYGATHGDLEVRAGGLTTGLPEDERHVDWLVRDLKVGDHVSIRIVNSESPSDPIDSRPSRPEKGSV